MIEMHRVIDVFVDTLVIANVNVRMYMRRAVVSVRMRVDEEVVRLSRHPAHSIRSFPNQTGGGADAEQNQHDCHSEFHRQSEPGGVRNFEKNDRGADDEHGECVPESPYDTDTSGSGQAMFAAQNCSDG